MSRLDDLIRECGCDELTALAWLKERRAFLAFGTKTVTVTVPRYGPMMNGTLPVLADQEIVSASLVGAVVAWLKEYGGK